MYFRLPSSYYLEKAYHGTASWLELDHSESGRALPWYGFHNELTFDRPQKTADGFTLITSRMGARAQVIDVAAA